MSATDQNSQINSNPKHEHNWKSLTRFSVFTFVFLLVIALLLWLYVKVMIPVLASIFIAYLLSPWVDYLERKKINRGVASAFIIVGVLLAIAIVVLQLGPKMYAQLVDLVQKVPALIDYMMKSGIEFLREVVKGSGMKDSNTIDRALRGFNFMEQALARAQLAVDGLWTTGANIMGTLFSMVLIPFVTFYVVFEKARILQFFKKITPRDTRPYFIKLFDSLDVTMKAVVRGHIKVAFTLSILYSIGFTSIGMGAGVAIGVAAGVCRIIPYLDAIVGSVLGVTYVFASGLPPTKIFAVFGVIGVVQVLDGAIITPKLIGSRVGLHPAIVILTVIAGSYHFGFLGVLLAIPVAATIKTVFNLILPVYRDSHWFRNHS